MQLAVMAGHQSQATKSAVKTLEWIASVKDFERVLKRVAPTTVNRGVNLNIPPRKHQQSGAKLIHRG
jgi:hypothetical protein